MSFLNRPSLYKSMTAIYVLFHVVGFGICLHQTKLPSLPGKPSRPTTHYPLRYKKKLFTITNQIIEQADVMPFLADTLRKLQQRKPVDLNAKDFYGHTALHYAAKLKNHLLVSILLEQGADLEAKTDSNRTALQIAAAAGNLSVVQALLAVPTIDINAQDNYAETALYLAAEAGHTALVEMLLRHPTIAVDTPNLLGKTAFTIAYEKRTEAALILRRQYTLIVDKITAKLAQR